MTVEPIEWVAYSDAAVAAARAAGRPVVIDFTATWCLNCHALEATTLHDPAVFLAVKKSDALMVKGDVTNKTTPASPLLAKLDPYRAIPLTAVYLPNDPDPVLLDGIYSADELVSALSGK